MDNKEIKIEADRILKELRSGEEFSFLIGDKLIFGCRTHIDDEMDELEVYVCNDFKLIRNRFVKNQSPKKQVGEE